MIKSIVIDDEKPAREEIIYQINKITDLQCIGSFSEVEEAFDFLKRNHVDIIFLDINMPRTTGVEFAKQIKNYYKDSPKIIFITAYDNFAVNAFELGATDYILKPICESRFVKSMKDVLYKIKKDCAAKNKFITLQKNSDFYPINKKDIKMLHIQDREVVIITTAGIFHSNLGLNKFESKLVEPYFIRVHRSYIVNINFIEKMTPWFNSTYNLKLLGIKESIPVSRNRIQYLKEIISII